MTNDEKIDEVLKIVQEQGERSESRDDQLLRRLQELDKKNDSRLSRLEARNDQLLGLIREQAEKSEVRDKELSGLILEERGLNNSRFTQLSTGLMDLRKGMDVGFAAVNAKIDKVHESLSADINAFGEDLYETKRRVTRLEKKLLS